MNRPLSFSLFNSTIDVNRVSDEQQLFAFNLIPLSTARVVVRAVGTGNLGLLKLIGTDAPYVKFSDAVVSKL